MNCVQVLLTDVRLEESGVTGEAVLAQTNKRCQIRRAQGFAGYEVTLDAATDEAAAQHVTRLLRNLGLPRGDFVQLVEVRA